MELAAIWIDKPVGKINSDGHTRTCRITVDDLVIIRKGVLQHMTKDDKPTHKILGCYGDESSSLLEFLTVDLRNMNLEILKIK